MLWALVGGIFLYPSLLLAVESHPGLEAEAAYSEAVVAFHRKQSVESLIILNRLLLENPENISALELKALNLKNLGREKEMLEVYQELLKAKPAEERGPIYFELGTLQQRYKKTAAAKVNLLKAIEAKFNEIPAHLLVGIIDFTDGDLAEAEGHFQVVRRLGSSEMEMVSTFYLGLINLKRGRGAIGAAFIVDARDMVEKKKKDSQMARDLAAPIQQILDPFNQSRWFSNVSVLGQYDSNIAQIPTAATAQQGSGQATPKTTLLAGFGYMGAPLSTLQFVPSYRFNANKNLSETARAFEFASNTLALAVNIRPLGLVSGGLKGEFTHTFQNQTDATYRQFSLAADMGPFFRWTMSQESQLSIEAAVRPQINYSQSDLGGTGIGGRINYRRDAASRYFNPSLSAGIARSGTRNLNFNATATTLGFSNLFRLPGDYQATGSLDLALTQYPDADPVRSDTTASLRGNVARPINASVTLLGDFSFVMNRSTLSGSFSYDRWQLGFGASFNR